MAASPLPATQGAAPQKAVLKVNFDAPVAKGARKSVLPVGTTTLALQGYDKDGNVVYGPTEVSVPPSNILEIEVPIAMTSIQIAGLAPSVQAKRPA